jgi:hypothetical protein
MPRFANTPLKATVPAGSEVVVHYTSELKPWSFFSTRLPVGKRASAAHLSDESD